MSYLNTTSLANTNYKVVNVAADQDIRSDPSSWEKDQYAEMVRFVLQWDIQQLQSIEVVDGLIARTSIDGVYFQGTGPFTLTPPSGFGPFILIRQNMDAIEIDGAEFLRITEEYVTRAIVGGAGDDAGDPQWTTFDWGP